MIQNAFLNAVQIHNAGIGNIGLNRFDRKLIPRPDRIDRPRDHGSVDYTRFYSGQMFTLGGWVAGATIEATLDTIRAAIWLDNAVTLKYQRQGVAGIGEQAVVVVSDADWPVDPKARYLQPWALELFAADPRLYAQTQTTTVLTASGGAISGTVTNGGNVNTPVVWTITGPTSGAPVITNSTTGHNIVLNTAVSAGHTLVIDTYAKTVLLDGSTAHPDYITAVTTFWDGLAVGANSISLTGGGFTNGVSKLQAVFRDARG
jgi:hypothetical protein